MKINFWQVNGRLQRYSYHGQGTSNANSREEAVNKAKREYTGIVTVTCNAGVTGAKDFLRLAEELAKQMPESGTFSVELTEYLDTKEEDEDEGE